MADIIHQNDRGQELPVPEGKVVGFVPGREQLDAILTELRSNGYDSRKVRVLEGPSGIDSLKILRDVDFFGDWERPVIDLAITELEKGHFVVSVAVEDRDESLRIANIASPHGAHSFSYFGTWMNEQITK